MTREELSAIREALANTSISENRDFRNDVIDLLKCISDLEQDNEILNNFLVKTAEGESCVLANKEQEIHFLQKCVEKLEKEIKNYKTPSANIY